MKVYGVEIPAAVLDTVYSRMRRNRSFTAFLVEGWVSRGMVADLGDNWWGTLANSRHEIESRIAGRLLQAARKAGNITYTKAVLSWRWVRPTS